MFDVAGEFTRKLNESEGFMEMHPAGVYLHLQEENAFILIIIMIIITTDSYNSAQETCVYNKPVYSLV